MTLVRGRWILFLALLLTGITALQAASLNASLNRSTITLGENATLSLKFEDGSPKDAPNPPAVAGLRIDYVGPSSEFSFINGRTTSSVTHNYIVTPTQAGSFTIPSITAIAGGQRLTTQPLRLTVLKPAAPLPEAIQSGSQLAFMRLVLTKRDIYVGETVAGELDLYFHQTVQNIGNFQLTSQPPDGITMGKFVQGEENRTQIGNAIYRIVPLAFTLSAVKAGTFKIGPLTATVIVQIPSGNRRGDPFFEQFGIRDPFSAFNSQQKQVGLAAEAETIRLLPLPKDKVPTNFNGAVGTYDMAVSAGPTNIAVGDPITVRIQISGQGALDSLSLPEQPAWKDFKTYPPTSKPAETTDQLGLQGMKSFEQIVVPQNMDVHELPGFTFSFFDPEAKAYRTLSQPPVTLTVRPGGTTPVPMLAANNSRQQNAPPVQQDIVPIKQRLGTLAQVSPPLVTQSWFLGVQSVPVLAFLAAFIWRKRTDLLANNPRLRRQRLVVHIIRDGLSDLRRLAAENNSDDFFATLFRLLQEQLGERLDCPASAITEAVVDDKLRPHGVEETTLDALHELFQLCNQARYAPIKSSHELAAIVPRLENALNELREVKI